MAPPASAAPEKDQASRVTLNVRVLRARNLRGTRGEKVNSIVRAQFADFDTKDVS